MPAKRSSIQAIFYRTPFTLILTASLISSAALAQDDTISFADEVVCAVPRVELPEILKMAPMRDTIVPTIVDATAEEEGTEAEESETAKAQEQGEDAQAGNTDETAAEGEEAEGVVVEAQPVPEEPEEIALEGDSMDIVDQNKVVMTGNAQVVQGRRGVFADEIIYDQDNYVATATGGVRYYTLAGDEIKTESMRLEVDTFIGETDAAEMRIVAREPAPRKASINYIEDYSPFAPITNRIIEEAEADADAEIVDEDQNPLVENRIYADRIEIEGVDFQRLHNARVTRCPEGEDVLITGKEVELDHIEGVGYAKNVTVRFKGVPILYSPRFSFPLNDERKTGVLAPSVGHDDVSGVIASVPYYFNIAPTADATVRATYYENRGTQLYGEFRYLNEFGDAELRAEHISQDELFDDESRYAIGLDLRQNYSNGWDTSIDLQDVSDTSYLQDYKNDINLTSATHLPQTFQLNYNGDYLYMRGRASKYVAVTPELTTSNPFDRLPQIGFGIRPQKFGLFEFALDSEYVSFEHDDDARLTGTRFNMTPSVSMPIEPIYGYVKPKLSFKSINYQLENTEAGAEENPSAAAPIFSVDSGVFFEREIQLGERAIIHTLEPRAMYVYIPEEDQDDAPLFDTGLGSVNSYNILFREERLFGGDRIGDDHHVALGVTTRFIDDEDGEERLRASIGQLYYLDDREVGLNSDDEPDTDVSSDVFAEFSASITNELKVDSFVRWDPDEKAVDSVTAGLEYKSGRRRFASVDYFKNKELDENVRLELNWPLLPRVQLHTVQRYSIQDEELRASAVGLVYDGCCWAFGLKFSQWIQNDGETRETILATLELDGLGSIHTSQ